MAIRCASARSSGMRFCPGPVSSTGALSNPSSQKRIWTLIPVRVFIDSASAMRPSLCHSSPFSSTSARLIVRAGDLPRWATSLSLRFWDSVNTTLHFLEAIFGSGPHCRMCPNLSYFLYLCQYQADLVLVEQLDLVDSGVRPRTQVLQHKGLGCAPHGSLSCVRCIATPVLYQYSFWDLGRRLVQLRHRREGEPGSTCLQYAGNVSGNCAKSARSSLDARGRRVRCDLRSD